MTTLTEREWQQEMERLRSRQRALLGRMAAMGSYLDDDETARWEELVMQVNECSYQMKRIMNEYWRKLGVVA